MEQKSDGNALKLHRASARDFASIDLATLLQTLQGSDGYALETALNEALRDADARENEGASRALRVLTLLCTLHFRVDDPATPFAARWSGRDSRGYEARDFRGEQNAVLAEIAGSIAHPALRARVADVAWFNERGQWKAAEAAIEAYCDVVRKRVSGEFAGAFDAPRGMIGDAVDFLHRAIQVATGCGKWAKFSVLIDGTFSDLYSLARVNGHYVHFERLARLAVEYKLLEWNVVANDAEALARAAGADALPDCVRLVWRLAADAHEQMGDGVERLRCGEAAVEQLLRNRERVSHPGARAHWTRVAIAELRQIGGSTVRLLELQRELRRFQDEAVDATMQFATPIDVNEEQAEMFRVFKDISLSDCLLRLAVLASCFNLNKLRDEALNALNGGFWGTLFGSSYTDAEGKLKGEINARSADEPPNEAQLKEQYNRILDLHRHIIVYGRIEPARRTVMTRFPVDERIFRPIVRASPFVPPGHEHIFCLGFARFWQGDFASAVHLLVPQIENSMRYVLLNGNDDSSKMSPELVQEDRTLGTLLEKNRAEVEKHFGPNLANDMEMLFTYKLGPALRHELAHGKLYDGACFSANAIYACWLVYHITVAPVVQNWEEWIAPQIEAIAH
ncbi:UNVERIFIED_ORG: hypothetical protein ABIC54_004811 [Burkholderia sp. 1263]